jgi:hypothetical protein
MVIKRVVSIEELMDTIYNLSQWFIDDGWYILVIFIVEVELELIKWINFVKDYKKKKILAE